MIWYDDSGRRCTRPPEHIVLNYELRFWYDFIDTGRQRKEASAELAEWRRSNPNETYEDDPVVPDKRFKGHRIPRKTG